MRKSKTKYQKDNSNGANTCASSITSEKILKSERNSSNSTHLPCTSKKLKTATRSSGGKSRNRKGLLFFLLPPSLSHFSAVCSPFLIPSSTPYILCHFDKNDQNPQKSFHLPIILMFSFTTKQTRTIVFATIALLSVLLSLIYFFNSNDDHGYNEDLDSQFIKGEGRKEGEKSTTLHSHFFTFFLPQTQTVLGLTLARLLSLHVL